MNETIARRPTDLNPNVPIEGGELAHREAIKQIERRRRYWISTTAVAAGQPARPQIDKLTQRLLDELGPALEVSRHDQLGAEMGLQQENRGQRRTDLASARVPGQRQADRCPEPGIALGWLELGERWHLLRGLNEH